MFVSATVDMDMNFTIRKLCAINLGTISSVVIGDELSNHSKRFGTIDTELRAFAKKVFDAHSERIEITAI